MDDDSDYPSFVKVRFFYENILLWTKSIFVSGFITSISFLMPISYLSIGQPTAITFQQFYPTFKKNFLSLNLSVNVAPTEVLIP